MRMSVLAPTALMVLAATLGTAWAAGRGTAETCINAGYRMGSPAFDMCVARMSGDDPLAALEGGQLDGRSEGKPADSDLDPLGAITAAKPPAMDGMLPALTGGREEMPASFSNPPMLGGVPTLPGNGPATPSTPSPSPGGFTWPTPPTAPTLPSVVAPNVPIWNFGAQ
ncbi:MAG: hypothetical protein NVV74_14090 [Magnetospirillum sp.]|nr:hypothetical protein [Magnetospirillum sp.]